jgi:hypothetical protein
MITQFQFVQGTLDFIRIKFFVIIRCDVLDACDVRIIPVLETPLRSPMALIPHKILVLVVLATDALPVPPPSPFLHSDISS